MCNLNGMFDQINTQIGEVAANVGTTPAAWNAGVFSMIRTLSDNVVVPIAGMILTFVLCYELITMIIDRNNLHDFETFIFYKWIVKAFVAVMLVTHTFDITMAIFDVAQNITAPLSDRRKVNVRYVGTLVAQQMGDRIVSVNGAHAVLRQPCVLLRCIGVPKSVEGQTAVGTLVADPVAVAVDEQL